MLHAGAFYMPEPAKRAEDTLEEGSQSAPSKSSQVGEVPSFSTDLMSGDADTLPPYVACEARNLLAHFSNRLQDPSIDPKTDSGAMSTSLLSTQGNVGVPDNEKLRRAKVASCLDAMAALQRGTEGFLESIEQPHLQVTKSDFPLVFRS